MGQTLKDRDIGDLAVRHHFISPEELEAVLEAQKLSDPTRAVSEILLEMQLVTQTQLDRLMRMREKPTEQLSSINDLFGRLAVQLEFASTEQVDECLTEQRLLESQGQHMRLGQIMLKRRHLNTEQFLEILRLQEKTVLTCLACQARYLAGDLGNPEAGGIFRCTTCQSVLSVPGSSVPKSEALTPPIRAVSPPPEKPPSSHGPESGVETIRMAGTPKSRPPSTSAKPPSQASGGGKKMFGRYEALEILGRGPLGVVYRARDLQRHRTVALKVLEGEKPDPQVAQRFLRDARLAAQLDHPGIVEIHEVGSNEESPYFAMEFVEGRTLARMLEERRAARDEFVSILEKACRAAEYAHSQGVTHRNLKPSNILVDSSKAPRLSDFGHRARASAASAPELVRGEEESIDARSDVYSLGAILYEILTGRPPYEGSKAEEIAAAIEDGVPPRPRTVVPDLPRELELICLKAMDRDRALRYPSGGEMADDLRRYLEGEPVTARPISVITRVGSRVRRHWGLSVLLPLLVLLLAGGVVFGMSWWKKLRKQKERETADARRKQADVPYKEGFTLQDDSVRPLQQDRENLRDLRGHLRDASLKSDEAARLLPREQAEVASALRGARSRFSEMVQSLLAGTAQGSSMLGEMAAAREKLAQATRSVRKPSSEVDRLLRETGEHQKEAERLLKRIKAWPGEVRLQLEAAIAKLDVAIGLDPEHPESLHLRGRLHLLLGRYGAAGTDFAAAHRAYQKTIAWKEEEPSATADLERLRRMQSELRYERGKYLFLVYELWRGRPMVLFGDGGESLSFTTTETAPAEKTRREMAEEFRAFLASGRGEPPEIMLAQTALYVAGEAASGFKLSEADPYLRGDKSDGVPLRVLALAHQKDRSVRKPFEQYHAAAYPGSPLIDHSKPLYGLPIHPRVALEWALELHSQAIAEAATPELLANRGVLKLALRRFEEAQADFDKALESRPADAEIQLRKAAVLAAMGKTDAAFALVRQVAAGGTSTAEAVAWRASLLLNSGDPEAALPEVEKALKLLPEDPTLLYLLGRVHLARGDASLAMHYLRRAADSLPSFYQAHALCGAAKVEIQDWLGAKEAARESIRLRPDYALAYIVLARDRHRNGDMEAAESDLDHAAKLDPRSPLPWIWRAEFLRLNAWVKSREFVNRRFKENLTQKSFSTAITQARDAYGKAASIDPTSVEAHAMALMCRLELGEDEAWNALTDLIKRFPKAALPVEIRAAVHYFNQRYAPAIQDWELADKLQPARKPYFREKIEEAKRKKEEEESRPAWFKGFDRANKLLHANRYPDGLKAFREAEKTLPAELPPERTAEYSMLVTGAYNYACALAVAAGEEGADRRSLVEEAFKWLQISIELGFGVSRDGGSCRHANGAEHARFDVDLKILREDPRFLRILQYAEH